MVTDLPTPTPPKGSAPPTGAASSDQAQNTPPPSSKVPKSGSNLPPTGGSAGLPKPTIKGGGNLPPSGAVPPPVPGRPLTPPQNTTPPPSPGAPADAPLTSPKPGSGNLPPIGGAPVSAPSAPGQAKPAGQPPTPPPPPATPPTASGSPGAVPPPPAATTKPSPTPVASQPKKASGGRFAAVKSSPLKFVPFVVGGLVVFGLVVFVISSLLGGGSSSSVAEPTGNQGAPGSGIGAGSAGSGTGNQVTLTYWTLWEPCEVFEPAFAEFEQEFPGILVDCEQQVGTDYRERLQVAISNRTGPDLFRFHASWVPMLTSELDPIPSSVMSASEYRQTFYPIAEQQLQVDGQLVGMPLMYDGLLLYYNKDIFETAALNPPQTWLEVKEAARTLTLRSGDEITRGGMAIGNSTNVEHFSDILGLLILQNGGDPAQPTDQEVLDAVTFYTNFIAVDNVWSSNLPSSTVAFARGEAAMMLAPSWRAHEVAALNPSLNFGVVGAPQLSTSEQMTWATYWAEGVSSQSEYQQEAWELLRFMTSASVMQDIYAEQSKIRGFGEPFARPDLADQVANDEVVSVLLSQAPLADNWYLNSFTDDGGLNDALVKYYEDAVTAVLGGSAVSEVMETVQQGTAQTLRQYDVPSSQ